MNQQQNIAFVNRLWDENIIPTLMEYIKIPNKSPRFDRKWHEHGHMYQAVDLIAHWCRTHGPAQMTLEVIQREEKTPLIFMDIPGQSNDTILLYGHLDKQPEMSGWSKTLGPWQPVLRGDRLYGRGGADDGYAAFASLAAIQSLSAQGIPHARCIILIEASEESGSCDLPFYIDALSDRIGSPRLVICLDSGCGNYDQLWTTTSLRGQLMVILTVDVLTQGVHSGNGSGIVPSCFQIMRQLLNRIENEVTGDILLTDLFVDIPTDRIQQADNAASILGSSVFNDLPFHDSAQPRQGSITDLILNRTWRPALSVIGCDGLPPIENAGNVTIPSLTLKLSMRLPPTADVAIAKQSIHQALTMNPPYQAKITCHIPEAAGGWNAPAKAEWLAKAIDKASLAYFGKPAVYMGEGGSIPFMGMLGRKFPHAQFFITGLLGPGSNAHGPDEFLHIPTGKKLTACVAEVIARQYEDRR